MAPQGHQGHYDHSRNMGHFVNRLAERNRRYCRTHALVARLFAAHSFRSFNSDALLYVARSWENLEALKAGLPESRTGIVDVPKEAAAHLPRPSTCGIAANSAKNPVA
jgi:hypothetical protein